jgi:nucleoid-associated protein YgaU
MARMRHAGTSCGADLNDVTAVAAAHPWVRPRAAVAPAAPDRLRRAVGTLHEPNAWTVGVLLATGVVLLARHPIAKALGTEVAVVPATSAATSAPPHGAQTPSLSLSLPTGAVATHAPRDPFRALVSAGGKLLAPEPIATSATGSRDTTAPAATTAAAPAAASAAASTSCTGTTHRVVAGDTLWTLAARAVHSSETGRVTVAWHRIYAANRDTLGANPGLLHVGESLCVPSSL